MAGKLIICPTPIGNLGDMTERALAALRSADAVCAEDTRVTGKLLAAFRIEKRIERLDEALIGERASSLVERVAAGEVIAYCSDAGMPGVSDPGLRLVRAAREAGVPVEVLPGATAVATAYVASGSANPRFYFGGFFPRKDAERRAVVESLRAGLERQMRLEGMSDEGLLELGGARDRMVRSSDDEASGDPAPAAACASDAHEAQDAEGGVVRG